METTWVGSTRGDPSSSSLVNLAGSIQVRVAGMLTGGVAVTDGLSGETISCGANCGKS